ncbi:MAG: adenylate kinase family protein [Nanoarchaeota archaeon]
MKGNRHEDFKYRLVIIGAPGSGKGTIGDLIQRRLHLPHISTGDIFRHHIDAGDALGTRIKESVTKGELIPDEITEAVVEKRLSEEDVRCCFLLDGFPRDLEQARFLLDIRDVDGILHVTLDDESIVKRLSKRRICSECETGFHLISKPPEKEGVCDECGGKLIARDDDAPDVVRERLSTYHETTEPVIGFFEKKGIPVLDISGDFDLETESDDIIDRIVQWQESQQG